MSAKSVILSDATAKAVYCDTSKSLSQSQGKATFLMCSDNWLLSIKWWHSEGISTGN